MPKADSVARAIRSVKHICFPARLTSRRAQAINGLEAMHYMKCGETNLLIERPIG
jgi:hypothetical protein